MVEAKILNLPPELLKPEDKFLEMVALPKFRKALRMAARRTSETGHETGFAVISFANSQFWIEEVTEGTGGGMSNAKTLEEIDGEFDGDEPFDYYFNLHFHYDQELITPSTNDVKLFSLEGVFDKIDYVGVGTVAENRKISVLVLIKPRFRLRKHDLEFYDEVVNTVKDYPQLQALFSSIGISSFLLKY